MVKDARPIGKCWCVSPTPLRLSLQGGGGTFSGVGPKGEVGVKGALELSLQDGGGTFSGVGPKGEIGVQGALEHSIQGGIRDFCPAIANLPIL